MLRMMGELTTRGVESFKRLEKLERNPVFIANYSEMIADPMAMVKRIYSYFQINLTDNTEQEMRKYLDSHPQNKFGRHNYSLEKYGLTLEDVKNALQPYANYFTSKGYTDVI